MELYKFFPKPSDRMGTIWTLSSIDEVYIVEFGPAGTTHFAIEGMMQLNGESKASVFTTDLDESDVSFGKTERLEKAIVEVDQNHNPKVIFVMASSISAIIGTDIENVCINLEDKVNARLIPITTGGYNGDYSLGIEKTLEMLCKEIVRTSDTKKKNTYNIIGSNIDMYNFLSDTEEIKKMMKCAFNMDVNTTFTAYTSIDEIENAGSAEINLILRNEGIKGAKILEKSNSIPYHYGRPYGLKGTMDWITNISEKHNLIINEQYIKDEVSRLRRNMISYKMMTRELKNKKVILVGDLDVVVGLTSFVEEIGLLVEKIIVKHSTSKKVKETVPERYKKIIEFDLSEMEIEKYLNSQEIYLLLGDGGTLKLQNKSELKFQISNPNLLKHNIYPYTPFVGFSGALYLIQCLYELEKGKLAV
ncbi:nitrogenase iron-molybdenum cofactor biosynthesis protein NifE [Gottschalkia acidurici 9a]|uniref:Nitrogenase iron-molybdenum cofactor biosynthesis protein NifE n=1 Tax=Gottschalkia acidurici (strain ATCC 7906 / DSM 604 / BCRC 14475 / CIP 104303 / KCTC 5404 / NCIMB 10678 / 9a) TaxID=1128398 RepID=K0AUD6_GOTA9|nr:nitrogenase component 1 [Gottschalkia acidurici]AFS77448.1 nitrogenase iron-molybdenum cofactor biosynthesis protein NifE [Gottschalkia acidurici 9a]